MQERTESSCTSKILLRKHFGGGGAVSETGNFPFNGFPFCPLYNFFLLHFSMLLSIPPSNCAIEFFPIVIGFFFFYWLYWPNNVVNCQDAAHLGNFWGQTFKQWASVTTVERILQDRKFSDLFVHINTYTLWGSSRRKIFNQSYIFYIKTGFWKAFKCRLISPPNSPLEYWQSWFTWSDKSNTSGYKMKK